LDPTLAAGNQPFIWGPHYMNLGRVRLQLQNRVDLEVSVRSIWQLSDLELLQICNRVKFTVVELELLASDQSGAFFQINRQVESGALLVRPSDRPPCPHRHRPYRRQYYCCSCRPIRCPLLNSYCRLSDPTGQKTSLILSLI